MQKARRHPNPLAGKRLRLVVSVWFQVLFTRLLGVLFTFPSRYWFAIGHERVFSLGGWCPQLQTGFLRPRPTQDPRWNVRLASTGLSPSSVRLSRPLRLRLAFRVQVLQPRSGRNHGGLGCFPFARHYSGNRVCFLFLRVLRCFSSPGWLRCTYVFSAG